MILVYKSAFSGCSTNIDLSLYLPDYPTYPTNSLMVVQRAIDRYIHTYTGIYISLDYYIICLTACMNMKEVVINKKPALTVTAGIHICPSRI